MLCRCTSGLLYRDCCEPFHKGTANPKPLQLMRSRFCAYALHLSDYIMQTTHPENPSKNQKKEIEQFSQITDFEGLEILSVEEGSSESFVTFRANLKQQGRDVSFTEKSRFLKVDDRWLYINGEIRR